MTSITSFGQVIMCVCGGGGLGNGTTTVNRIKPAAFLSVVHSQRFIWVCFEDTHLVVAPFHTSYLLITVREVSLAPPTDWTRLTSNAVSKEIVNTGAFT